VIGHVIAMREIKILYAAQRFEAFHQRGSKTRRIDQDIPLFSLDEITGRSERVFGMISGMKNIFRNGNRERIDGFLQIRLLDCADRCGRTGD
jgi:hypothetical protein